jgi:AcrR family transcriptional regulator
MTTLSVQDAILERAIETIDAKGEAGIRVRDLVDAVGVTAPVLYRAFGSREGLIIAAQTERYRRALYIATDNFLGRLALCTSPDELRNHIDSVLDIVLSDQRAEQRRIRMNVMGSAITRPELLASLVAAEDRLVEELVPYFDRFQRNGWIRDGLDSRTWLHWYLALVNARAGLEVRTSGIDPRLWDAHSRLAILTTLFGFEQG